jgi:CheY-like chemotaxis protein
MLAGPANSFFPIPSALIAEPDDDTYALYELMLGDAVKQIRRAEDGRDALALVLSNPPSVVVTEAMMPLLDGFTLCSLLRADQSTARVPIIVATTQPDARADARARAAGADAVLVKPFLIDHVLTTVRRVLETSREHRLRAKEVRALADSRLADAKEVLKRSQARKARSRIASYPSVTTIDPPSAPPPLWCPECNLALRYVRSHLGGVDSQPPEQWDYFECPATCGTFQFRQRTRTLRRIS